MKLVVIDPPAPIVSLALAKAHLRVDNDDEDSLISLYIGAAQGAIDGPEGWLGKAVGVQTLELRLPAFFAQQWRVGRAFAWEEGCWTDWSFWPFNQINLPCPPLKEVVSITYEDLQGNDQVLDPSGWRATDDGLTPAFNDIWPDGRIEANAVRVRYTAGYDIPPAPIVSAVLMAVSGLYANREDVVIASARVTQVINDAYTNLLSPHWRLSAD
jgi:uncharacterized phiE125 gp8 family phage protein